MNLKNVLRTYVLLRQLTDDESALLNTLRNLSEPECELLIESLAPQQAAKSARKQPERCTHVYESGLVCKATARNYVHHNSAHLDFHQFTIEKQKKSKRAESLSNAVRSRASRTVTGPACSICGNVEDHPDHDTAHYLSAHEFDSGKSTVRGAAQASSANGEGQSSTQNSEAQAASTGT